MKVIHIENSYNTWLRFPMRYKCYEYLYYEIHDANCYPPEYLNRTWCSIYIEWWLHNIGYWFTLPFVKLHPSIAKINSRCKDVDLEEHK